MRGEGKKRITKETILNRVAVLVIDSDPRKRCETERERREKRVLDETLTVLALR